MNPVLFLVDQAPYYNEEVTKEGENTENPDADLKRVVLHEVVAAGEFIDWGIAVNAVDRFLGVTAQNEAVEFSVWEIREMFTSWRDLISLIMNECSENYSQKFKISQLTKCLWRYFWQFVPIQESVTKKHQGILL